MTNLRPLVAFAALAALATFVYRNLQPRQAAPVRLPPLGRPGDRAAAGEPETTITPFVRPAGPEAMRDPPRDWDAADETSDESFPASDPPARY